MADFEKVNYGHDYKRLEKRNDHESLICLNNFEKFNATEQNLRILFARCQGKHCAPAQEIDSFLKSFYLTTWVVHR